MAQQRLPKVNQDDGTWGDIIRTFLLKEHYDDGTDNTVNGGHKNVTIRASDGTAGSAPLTFATGTLLSTKAAGAMEFNADTLYFTITTGTTRRKIAMIDETASASAATGDLYYRDSSGNFARVGIGSSGQQLTVSGGLPAWKDNFFSTATASGTTYTISATNTVVFASAALNNVTITLPPAASFAGYRFYIKRTDNSTNTVTITRDGATSNTIDGMTSFTLDLQYTACLVVSDGNNWYIL